MLAEGALKVSNLSVAKPASSLPSSSKTKIADSAVKKEVEGGALVSKPAEDTAVLSAAADQQPLVAKVAEDDIVAQTEEKSAERTAAAAEKAEQLEQRRLEKLTDELNGKLNENLALRFGRDVKSGEDFFQLVEKATGDVVRQFPPQSVLDFREKFNDFAGVLFNQEG